MSSVAVSLPKHFGVGKVKGIDVKTYWGSNPSNWSSTVRVEMELTSAPSGGTPAGCHSTVFYFHGSEKQMLSAVLAARASGWLVSVYVDNESTLVRETICRGVSFSIQS